MLVVLPCKPARILADLPFDNPSERFYKQIIRMLVSAHEAAHNVVSDVLGVLMLDRALHRLQLLPIHLSCRYACRSFTPSSVQVCDESAVVHEDVPDGIDERP